MTRRAWHLLFLMDRRKMENFLDILKEQIIDADMVLVGIGEDFGSTKKQIFENGQYHAFFSDVLEENKWMLPYFYSRIMEKEIEKKAYTNLARLLNGKNYFIISLRTDEIIYKSEFGFPKERIVTPCGGVTKLQCENNCEDKLYDLPEEMAEKLENILKNEGKEMQTVAVTALKCPNCGADLVFNEIGALNYSEAGYLPMWEKYTKWLQGTLNHKLCILELGVGMKYPSVIRWPFEKMAFFNNKAQFFRIHKKLYHLTEELKEKGYGIAQNPIEFMSNSFE